MGLDVKTNDLVQVVFGDFKGVHGTVVEILPKMLKIKSANIDMNGLIIE